MRLILPYAICLVVASTLLAFGLLALWSNGVAAELGFLQILCTTAESDGVLRRLAKECSQGGSAQYSDELKMLEVRYGGLGASEKVGFGTLEEVRN